MKNVNTVVVEDERIARDRLISLLAAYPWINLVGSAADGASAAELIDRAKPDLVFLDIELPEFDGIELIRRISHRPLLVFTTAYDRYAISAFELAALDYLLKPFGEKRLAQAMERVETRFAENDNLRDVSAAQEAFSAPKLLERMLVRHAGKVIPLAVIEIERLESDDDYVTIHSKGRRFLVSLALADFEKRLDPERFVRIHRSHIVNLDFVEALHPDGNSQFRVQLRDGTIVTASRAASKRLREQAI